DARPPRIRGVSRGSRRRSDARTPGLDPSARTFHTAKKWAPTRTPAVALTCRWSRRSAERAGHGTGESPGGPLRLLPSLARLDSQREARRELAMPSPQFDPTATPSQGLAISNLIVRLLSNYPGRR